MYHTKRWIEQSSKDGSGNGGNARYPALAALFIEILSPDKALSLAFQKEDTDIVTVVAAIADSKKQMKWLGGNDFENLPTVKRFLDKIELNDGHQLYEDVVLRNFVPAKVHTISNKRTIDWAHSGEIRGQ